MKKLIGVFVFMFVGIIAMMAQTITEPTLGVEVVEEGGKFWELFKSIGIPILAIVFGMWKIFDWVKISAFSGKAAKLTDKIDSGLDGLALIAQGAGMERVATIVKEASDPFEKLSDVFEALEKHTLDGEFTKEEIQSLLENEGKELVVEGKDFYIKVLKKKE